MFQLRNKLFHGRRFLWRYRQPEKTKLSVTLICGGTDKYSGNEPFRESRMIRINVAYYLSIYKTKEQYTNPKES